MGKGQSYQVTKMSDLIDRSIIIHAETDYILSVSKILKLNKAIESFEIVNCVKYKNATKIGLVT